MNYFSKFAFFLLASTAGAHQVLKDDNVNAKVEEMANLDLSVELVAQFPRMGRRTRKSLRDRTRKKWTA